MDDDLQGTLENAAIFGAIQRGNAQRAGSLRSQGPPCPTCGGPIPMRGAKKCMHCGSDLRGDEHAQRDRRISRANEAHFQKAKADLAWWGKVLGLYVALPAAVWVLLQLYLKS